jgi:PhzF family phenazine biosynthesis protein
MREETLAGATDLVVMRAPIFQLDAFTSERFAGNPAAVVVLDAFLPDATLQSVAAENNLSETAFIVAARDAYRIRWFTPTTEVALCGHATLAAAAVIMERLETGRRNVRFDCLSGTLLVHRRDGGYVIDLPARLSHPVAAPRDLTQALGAEPTEVRDDDHNYIAVFGTPAQVQALDPDMALLRTLDRSGVIATAAGHSPHDFTSRYFAPAKGIPEDPVTGGAHCALVPFWADRLAKPLLHALQASPRGGEMVGRDLGDRVELHGQCVMYLEGQIHL